MRGERALRVIAVAGVLVLGTGAVSATAEEPGAEDVSVVTPVEEGAAQADPPEESASPEDPEADEPVLDDSVPDDSVLDEPVLDEPEVEAPTMVEETERIAEDPTPTADEVASVQATLITLDLTVAATGNTDIDYRTPLLERFPELTDFAPTLQRAPVDGTVAINGEQVTYLPRDTPRTPVVSFVLFVESGGVTHTVEVNLLVIIAPSGGLMEGWSSPGHPAVLEYGAGADWWQLYGYDYLELAPRVVSVDPIDPAVGSATISADGAMIEFAQATSATGLFAFGYTVEDSLGRQARGLARVIQLPVLHEGAITVSTPVNTPVVIDPVDAVGGAREYSFSYLPGGRSDRGGSIQFPWKDAGLPRTYLPAEGFVGTDNFTMVVLDSSGQTAQVAVTVTVGDPATQVVTVDPPTVKTGRLATTGASPTTGALSAGAALVTGGGLLVLRRRWAVGEN